MRIAHTSFLYALFADEDHFHRQAREAAGSPEVIVIPPEIFSETLALIHRRRSFDAARAAGDWLRAQGHVEVNPPSPEILERAWRVLRGALGRLSYPDSVVVAWCRSRGASPLAFDSRILAHARG